MYISLFYLKGEVSNGAEFRGSGALNSVTFITIRIFIRTELSVIRPCSQVHQVLLSVGAESTAVCEIPLNF